MSRKSGWKSIAFFEESKIVDPLFSTYLVSSSSVGSHVGNAVCFPLCAAWILLLSKACNLAVVTEK